MKNVKLQALKHFRETMIVDEGLEHAAPGIYTWIIKDGNFFANKVLTPQEIGSLHLMIDHLSLNDRDVTAAGEMIVSNDKIQFNLLSGTYYKSFSTKTERGKTGRDIKVNKTNDEMKELKEYVTTVMGELGKKPVEYMDDKKSFIAENMVTNNNSIQIFNRYFVKNEQQGGKRRQTQRKTRRSSKTKKARK